MPGLDANTLKIVVRGTQSDENSWSTATWCTLAAGSDVDGDNIGDIATAIQAGPVQTMVGSVGAHFWSLITTYLGITVYYYPDGSTTAENVGTADATPFSGSQTGYMPAYVSMVASLRTNFANRWQRGRNYIPVSGLAVGNTGQWSDTDCSDLANYWATYLTNLNALDLSAHGVTGLGACVASFTKGSVTPIINVEVDSLPDTQHRRQDKILALHKEIHAVTI